jgi:hypothetical protein
VTGAGTVRLAERVDSALPPPGSALGAAQSQVGEPAPWGAASLCVVIFEDMKIADVRYLGHAL